MVAILHDGENKVKLEAILEAARRRTGAYGFEKTTMTEIANDLQISKAALYYYFPDKESLFCAVVKKEMEEFFNMAREMTSRMKGADEMLFEYVNMRHALYRIFMNLTRLRFSSPGHVYQQFGDLKTHLRRNETELITEILRKGKKSGQFFVSRPEEAAGLFLEILQGIRMVVAHHKPSFELSKEDFDLIAAKHRQVVQLFVRSLKNK